jgi:3-hydroxyacyl-CoA dehydrogenase
MLGWPPDGRFPKVFKIMSERPSTYDSWQRAKSVCVIGTGTMGSGIAAHLVNLGFDVTVLDLTREQAVENVERARHASPPHFLLPDHASHLRIGSLSENLDWATEADWICEAVVERLDVKRQLFAALGRHIRPEQMVSTNTSGLQISLLAEALPEHVRPRFLGTHFFNPPRYLKLLELIPTDQSDPAAVAAMARFLEDRVARRVVVAKDTPGFIANRFGMWSMFHAIHTAERLQLTVEQVDAITGPFLGRPRSGSFRLNDLVGLDIMRDIARNLLERCPEDPYIQVLKTPASMQLLLERGSIGAKSGQGYYRKEGRELLSHDLVTGAYRERQEPTLPTLERLRKLPLGERIRNAMAERDEVGDFLRSHLVPVLKYADHLKEEISHNVRDFDRVMMWGFGWEQGPFELIDGIGPENLAMEAPSFYRSGKVFSFDGTYREPEPEPAYLSVRDLPEVGRGESFVLRDLGDGVLAFCLTTKMGTINPTVVRELSQLVSEEGLDRFVLTSEARSFSAGYDLNVFASAIEEGRLDVVDEELRRLHELGRLLEGTRSVAAIYGHCLGAGLEVALSCPRIAASVECQIGLPEAKVGLLPGGRGTVLMRLHNQGTAKRLAEVSIHITLGLVGTNAEHARMLGYLRPSDVTVHHPDRLLFEAKRILLEAAPLPMPEWKQVDGPVVGMIDQLQNEAKAKGQMSEYDEVIGDKIKSVFAKTDSFDEALDRERMEFLDLCRRSLTHARIKHMLETNKPLRN